MTREPSSNQPGSRFPESWSPVTRRRFLSWAVAGTAGLASGALASCGNKDDSATREAGKASVPAYENRNLMFVIPPSVIDIATNLTFVCATGEYPIRAQSSKSFSDFGSNAIAHRLNQNQLTHFVADNNNDADLANLQLNSNAVTLGVIWGRVKKQDVILGSTYIPPQQASLQVARQALQANQTNLAKDYRLAALFGANGVSPLSMEEYAALGDIQHLLGESAASLVYGHPQVMMVEGAGAAVTKTVINTSGVIPSMTKTLQDFFQVNRSPWGSLEDAIRGYDDATGQFLPQTMNPLVNAPDWTPPPGVSVPDVPAEIANATAKVFMPFINSDIKWQGRDVPSDLIANFKNTWTASQNNIISLVSSTPELAAIIKPGDKANSDADAFRAALTGKSVAITPVNPLELQTVSPESDASADNSNNGRNEPGGGVAPGGGVNNNGVVNFKLVGNSQSWQGGLRLEIIGSGQDKKQPYITVRIYNKYQRTVVFGAQYFDGQTSKNLDGNKLGTAIPVPIMPPVEVAQAPSDTNDPTWLIPDGTAFLKSIPLIAGIPIPSDQNYVTFDIHPPPTAVQFQVVAGALGTSPDWRKNFIGVKTDSDGNPILDQDGNQELVTAYQDGQDKNRTRPEWYNDAFIASYIMDIGVPAIMTLMDVYWVGTNAKDIYTSGRRRGVVTVDGVQHEHTYTKADTSLLKKKLGKSVNQPSITTFFEMLEGTWQLSKSEWTPSEYWVLAKFAWQLLTFLLCKYLLPKFLATLSVGTVSKLVPILGEIYAATALATNASQLAQASSEWVSSPNTVTWGVVGTFGITITVKPDQTATFSKSAASWMLSIYHQGYAEPTIVYPNGYQPGPCKDAPEDLCVGVMPLFAAGPRSEPFTITVPDMKFGGIVMYTVNILSEDVWIVGSGSTDWIDNTNLNKVQTAVNVSVMTAAVPLDSESTYERRWTTAVQSGTYVMDTSPTQPGTITNAPLRTGSIVVGEGTGFMSYVYENHGKWNVRQLMGSQTPGAAAADLAQTFHGNPPLLLVDPLAQLGTPNALNWILEPVDETAGNGAGYNVRKLNLDPKKFGFDPKLYYGRFRIPLTSLAMSPGGHLIGVNAQSGQLAILKPSVGLRAADGQPLAQTFAGTGNRTGNVPGLLYHPVGVAVAGNGTVVVLEQEALRLQAFDLSGNPMMAFWPNPTLSRAGASNDGSYYAPLTAGRTYLSVGTDIQGYVFVLSYAGAGSTIDDYRIEVFAPGSNSKLFQVNKVNAGSMYLGYFRDVYSLNFSDIPVVGGSGQTQPSTSIWTARTPHHLDPAVNPPPASIPGTPNSGRQ